MSDSPTAEEVLIDHMVLVYDEISGQVTQLRYETVAHGVWARVAGRWREIALEDESDFFMSRREIARKNYIEAREYFDDAIEDKKLTFEPEYRMWFV